MSNDHTKKNRQLKAGKPKSLRTTYRQSFTKNLSSNYAMALQLYLIDKQQAEQKGAKYLSLSRKKKNKAAERSVSLWSNIVSILARPYYFLLKKADLGILWQQTTH